MKPFANEPVLELRRAPVRARLADALREHDAKPALSVPVWIGDERREGEELVSTDPGNPERVVATAAKATEADVDAALAAAQRGSKAWAATPAEKRAEILLRAAQWLRERRLEAAALAVRECAKPWPEADADICEAIDFLEYYARGAMDIAQGAPLLQLRAARGRRRDLAVELPRRDPARDGLRRPGDGQRGGAQARRAVARLRAAALPGTARGRPPDGHGPGGL